MKAAKLSDRGVIRISGDDARHFLNGLVTSEVETLAPDESRFAALLTPQGKIVCDFIVAAAAEGLLLDCPLPLTAALAQKLTFYKLRAKVAVENLSESFAVLALWDGAPAALAGATIVPDPRGAPLGHRALLPQQRLADASAALGVEPAGEAAYEAHRIACGVPKGGVDFQYGDAFPHEVNMDRNGGVDFTKGCYVGQEVVSRMQHRGTARTRVIPVWFDGEPPPPGAAVSAGGRPLGTTGSSAQGRGLAMLRLDRAADALSAGEPIMAGDIPLQVDPAALKLADRQVAG